MIEFYLDHVRLINFILLFFWIAGLTATFVARRQKATRRVRRITMWVYFFFLNAAYGVADNLHDNIRINPPVVIATFILSGMLVALVWSPKGDDKFPPDDGSIGSRLLLWLDRTIVRFKTRHGYERNQHGSNQYPDDTGSVENPTEEVLRPVHRTSHLRRSA